MTKEEFKIWYEKFLLRNKGYCPSRIDFWLSKIDKFHIKIREIIGGEIVKKQFLLKNQQGDVPDEELFKISDEISYILPYYFADNGLETKSLSRPTVCISNTQIKLTKHILDYFRRRYKGCDEFTYQSNLERLNQLLSSLGEKWTRAKVKESLVTVNLSTTPMGFILLGHYGPDKQSCFRQNSNRECHKYWLAQTKNTFVITIDKTKKDGRFGTVARCIGWYDENADAIYTLNPYLLNDISEGEVIEGIKLFLCDIFKCNMVHREGFGAFYRNTAFQNPSGNWSFFKENSQQRESILNVNLNNITVFKCPRCNLNCNNDTYWSIIDDDLYCERCTNEANKSDLSGKLTFNELVPVINENGDLFYILKEESNKFKICKSCESYYINNSGEICQDCINKNFTYCDICNQLKPEVEMTSFLDEDICFECFKNELNIF